MQWYEAALAIQSQESPAVPFQAYYFRFAAKD
jgi:hypothetical protein